MTDEGVKKPYRMFCFHHAGGSASSYYKLVKSSEDAEFIPVEIPGRGTRISEPFAQDIQKLSESCAEAICSVLDERPVFLFGHSMGAAIAFKTAYILAEQYGVEIQKLIVAGRHAPQDEDPTEYRTYMGTDSLVQELIRIDAMDEEILSNSEFMNFFIPIIYSDYKLSESFRYHGEVLNIPITAHCGCQDDQANEKIMRRWESVCADTFVLKKFHGPHFFFNDKISQYASILTDEIKGSILQRGSGKSAEYLYL